MVLLSRSCYPGLESWVRQLVSSPPFLPTLSTKGTACSAYMVAACGDSCLGLHSRKLALVPSSLPLSPSDSPGSCGVRLRAPSAARSFTAQCSPPCWCRRELTRRACCSIASGPASAIREGWAQPSRGRELRHTGLLSDLRRTVVRYTRDTARSPPPIAAGPPPVDAPPLPSPRHSPPFGLIPRVVSHRPDRRMRQPVCLAPKPAGKCWEIPRSRKY